MILDLTATQLTKPGKGLPLLVVGPSIGTSVTALWSSCAARLAGRFHVVGWDLPGHGRSATTDEPFTIADLAAAVVTLIDQLRASTGSGRVSEVFYAGDSVGGAVGLQLLLDAPARIAAAAIISSGAKIGDAKGWTERADLVGRHLRAGRRLAAALVRAGISGGRSGDGHRVAAFTAGC